MIHTILPSAYLAAWMLVIADNKRLLVLFVLSSVRWLIVAKITYNEHS